MTEETGDATDREQRFNEIAAAYLQAVEAGQASDLGALLARHPDLASELRAFFDDHDRMNQIAAPLRAAVLAESEVSFGFEPVHAGRVLETLAGTIGSIPRILLPDTQLDDRGMPLVRPSSPEMPPPGDRADRYQLFGEIARGGMGAILKGRDTDLGRDLAVKVLLEKHQNEPDLVRRFVEEAQIGGQLQHPGIVPVYELGTFSDQRPYFTMKLVKGRTLAALLEERKRPSDDLPRLLGIFKQVCETIAYAHARSVIHRDLKPSNVMVGSFGEVQVMDWGLAKVLKAGGVADEESTQPAPIAVSVIKTVRSGSAEDESRAGSQMGTPAYMAPEQAAGEVEHVDRRADVFGLGSILCEILTRKPAYTGRTRAEVLRKAIRGDTADALARLDASGADPELVSLAEDCLIVEPLDRPLDAGVVSARVMAYLSGVQEKLRAAELAQAQAEARAEEEVKHRALADQLAVEADGRAVEAQGRAVAETRRRKATLRLAAVSVLAVMLLVGIGVGSFYHARLQRSYRNERDARAREASIRYFNNMLMAEREWTTYNVGRAEQLLDECIPAPGQANLRGWEWNYLKRQCHTELMTLRGPGDSLWLVVWNPDGRRVAASGYDDWAFRIWDTKTGAVVQTLRSHSDPLRGHPSGANTGATFSPDGTLLAAGGGTFLNPGEITIWDAASGRELKSFSEACGASSSVAFSPDGKRLAAASGEWDRLGIVTIWDVKTFEKLKTIESAEGEMALIGLAFSPDPDGKYLATASGSVDWTSTEKRPGEVKIRDSWTGDVIRILSGPEGHTGPLTSVAYSPDGKRLATTSRDKTVRIWDATTGEVVHILRGHTQTTIKVVFSPDGKRLASASEDSSVRIWDASSGQELFSLRGHTLEVRGVAFSPDGRRLATASEDQTIKIWDAGTGKEALTLGRHTGWFNGVAFSPDGRQVATASDDKTVRVFNVVDGQEVREPYGHSDSVWGVTFSPKGTLIASASGEWTNPKLPGHVTIREAATGKVIHNLLGHAGLVRAVSFSPDETRLATAGGEHFEEPGFVKVWNVKTGGVILTLRGHTEGLNAVAYSRDGRYLASAGWDRSVRVWNADTGEEIHVLEGHSHTIWSVAFSPDGKRIASGSDDGTVRLWDVVMGKEVAKFRGHNAGGICVAFSLDGKRLASGSDDHTVKIWDATIDPVQEALTLRGHTSTISQVAFSPDGNRIASASRDGTVKIWDGTPWIEPPAARSMPTSRAESPR